MIGARQRQGFMWWRYGTRIANQLQNGARRLTAYLPSAQSEKFESELDDLRNRIGDTRMEQLFA